MENFVDGLLDGKASPRTKAIVTVVLLLLLVLLLVPFVVTAAHVYNFEIPMLVVGQDTPGWFWTRVTPISAVAWIVLIAFESWLNDSDTVLKIVAALFLVAVAPYAIALAVAGIYAIAYGALAAIVVWCAFWVFILSD